MSNILVTGGAGFIGSYFVKDMLDYNLVVLDKMTYASDMKRLEDVIDQVTFVEGDICDSKLVNELMKKYQFKYIVNFAAESHVDRSIEDASSFIQTNIGGVQVLLDACLNQLKNDYLFMQISTDEVYGPSDIALDVHTPLMPKNPYAASKASAELLINAYKNTHGIKAIITRCNNNYGLLQHEEKFIPKICKSIINNYDIPVYGDGHHRRTWLHVKDHVSVLKSILLNGVEGVYNISGDHNLANKNLVQMIIDCFKSLGFNYKGSIKYVEDRKGHDFNYSIIDNSNIHDRINFEDGIMEMVQYYIKGR